MFKALKEKKQRKWAAPNKCIAFTFQPIVQTVCMSVSYELKLFQSDDELPMLEQKIVINKQEPVPKELRFDVER